MSFRVAEAVKYPKTLVIMRATDPLPSHFKSNRFAIRPRVGRIATISEKTVKGMAKKLEKLRDNEEAMRVLKEQQLLTDFPKQPEGNGSETSQKETAVPPNGDGEDKDDKKLPPVESSVKDSGGEEKADIKGEIGIDYPVQQIVNDWNERFVKGNRSVAWSFLVFKKWKHINILLTNYDYEDCVERIGTGISLRRRHQDELRCAVLPISIIPPLTPKDRVDLLREEVSTYRREHNKTPTDKEISHMKKNITKGSKLTTVVYYMIPRIIRGRETPIQETVADLRTLIAATITNIRTMTRVIANYDHVTMQNTTLKQTISGLKMELHASHDQLGEASNQISTMNRLLAAKNMPTFMTSDMPVFPEQKVLKKPVEEPKGAVQAFAKWSIPTSVVLLSLFVIGILVTIMGIYRLVTIENWDAIFGGIIIMVVAYILIFLREKFQSRRERGTQEIKDVQEPYETEAPPPV